jgi:hypothetical protein
MIGLVFAGLIGFSIESKAEAMPDSSASAEEIVVIRAEDDWIHAEINHPNRAVFGLRLR